MYILDQLHSQQHVLVGKDVWGFVLSENICTHVLGSKDATVKEWRSQVAEGRHTASIDSLLENELDENFCASRDKVRESMARCVPGLRTVLMAENLSLQSSMDLSRQTGADALASLVSHEWSVYRQWFAELAGRYNASEEECKKQQAAAKVELRNVAQKLLLGTSDPSETTNQSLVLGGLCRIHCVTPQDLTQKFNTVTEQWIKRWCAERGVGAETVAVLVVVDVSNKTRIPDVQMQAIVAYTSNSPHYKLVFPPELCGQQGYRDCRGVVSTWEFACAGRFCC